MIDWFASLKTSDNFSQFSFVPTDRIVVEPSPTGVIFGVEQGARHLTLDQIHIVMKSVAQISTGELDCITWNFSGVSLATSTLSALLHRWRETDEPPVLSIIALNLGTKRHMTRGLESFIGCELAASFSYSAQSQQAARNLARLSRHALIAGKLDLDAYYEGTEGVRLQLVRESRPSSSDMVTIMLQ